MVENAERLVRSELFAFFARACIAVATLFFLPLGAYYGKRAIDAFDKVGVDVADMKTQQQLLSQTLKYQQDQAVSDRAEIRLVVKDHEGRIRVLEAARAVMPRREN